MHPQTAKNRSKKALRKRNKVLRQRIADLHGEMLLLQTLLGLGDQFEKKGNRITITIPIPPGWERVHPGFKHGRDFVISFERTREGGDQI
jgi:hypothetical protein